MRKVIQITFATKLVALCEDGTIWALGSDNKWLQAPGIPEPEKVTFVAKGEEPSDIPF